MKCTNFAQFYFIYVGTYLASYLLRYLDATVILFFPEPRACHDNKWKRRHSIQRQRQCGTIICGILVWGLVLLQSLDFLLISISQRHTRRYLFLTVANLDPSNLEGSGLGGIQIDVYLVQLMVLLYSWHHVLLEEWVFRIDIWTSTSD